MSILENQAFINVVDRLNEQALKIFTDFNMTRTIPKVDSCTLFLNIDYQRQGSSKVKITVRPMEKYVMDYQSLPRLDISQEEA